MTEPKTESAQPVQDVFRKIAEEPIDPALDRTTWRAAWLAAARIVEVAKPIVPPGLCWNDSGVPWAGSSLAIRCDLLAGHAGAHQAKNARGGTAIWTDAEPFQGPELAQMTDAEAEVWDEFWDTDAARCCSCRSCNYYAPDYEQHKDEPCLLRTLVERIIAVRVAAALDDVDQRLAVRIGEGRDDPETSREGSYFTGFLDALESARHEVRWKRPEVVLPPDLGSDHG